MRFKNTAMCELLKKEEGRAKQLLSFGKAVQENKNARLPYVPSSMIMMQRIGINLSSLHVLQKDYVNSTNSSFSKNNFFVFHFFTQYDTKLKPSLWTTSLIRN